MKNATYMYYAAMAFLFLHYQFQLFKHLGSAISRFIGNPKPYVFDYRPICYVG